MTIHRCHECHFMSLANTGIRCRRTQPNQFTNSDNNTNLNNNQNTQNNRGSGRLVSSNRQIRQQHSRTRQTNSNPLFKNRRLIESPVNTDRLLDIFKATLYLSMKQYWDIPTEIALMATMLDPRLKRLSFTSDYQKLEAQEKLRQVYTDMKYNNTSNETSSEDETIIQESHNSETNRLLEDIFSDCINYNETNNDEITSYIQLAVEQKTTNPLEWWKSKENLPVLQDIAKKYLSVPATSVPSERLFSDAGIHLSAKRTCLSPNLFSKMLFLKRNRKILKDFEFNNS
jgi:hypothetical protein